MRTHLPKVVPMMKFARHALFVFFKLMINFGKIKTGNTKYNINISLNDITLTHLYKLLSDMSE